MGRFTVPTELRVADRNRFHSRRCGVATAAIASALVFGTGLQTAYADFWGGDIPLLGMIVTNTTQQLTKVGETLGTLKRTYDETRRLAAYADDAVKTFNAFRSYSLELFRQDVTQALESSFPELSYFRRQASGTGAWAKGTGELQRLVSYCVRAVLSGEKDGTGCAQLQETLSLQQARSAITSTFGTVPPVAGVAEVRAVDHEAAVALSASSADVARNQVTRLNAKALLAQCTGKNASSESCQAASHAAQIEQLRQGAYLGDQMAESNKLQSMRLLQENARRKREMNEAVDRRRLLVDGAGQAAPPSVEVRTEGVNLLGGAQ